MSEVTVAIISDRLRVLIGGVMHLSVHLGELVCIHAYKWGEDRYCIDYVLRTTKVETWYAEEETWTKILRGLNNLDLA